MLRRDYSDMMVLTERIYEEVFRTVLGTSTVTFGTAESPFGIVELDFKKPWRRARFVDLVTEHTQVPVGECSEAELQNIVASGKLDSRFYSEVCPADKAKEWSWGELCEGLFEFFVESHLIQPIFVIDFPRESTPLCKAHRGDQRLIERFEPYVYGIEIGNAYSELNDPVLQRQLFEEQASKAALGDELAHRLDEDFLRAIELGIPPTGGLGLGIDRLAMFVTGATTIKDVLCFPLIRT